MFAKPDVTLALAERAAGLAETLGADRKLYLAEAEAVESLALIRLQKIDRADVISARALDRLRVTGATDKVYGDLLLARGQIALKRDEVQAALANFQHAYAIFRFRGEPRRKALALQSIAQLYIRGGDSLTALKYYAQSDDEYSGDLVVSVTSHNNRGNAYLNLSKPREAEREFRAALDGAVRMNSASVATRILNNIAQAQVSQGHLSEARSTIDRAFRSARTPETQSELWAFWDIRAQIAFARKDLKSAAVYSDRALIGVDPATSPSTFRQAHETAYKIHRALGQTNLALANLEAMARIDKATAELTASTSAALMAARFDFANQNVKIARLKSAELERTVAFERARARLQRGLLIAIVIGSVLVLTLLIAGLILITRSRNRERAGRLVLARTNRELEKAISAKMEFLATTSHEIRTPLNGILGMTQVMLSDRTLGAAVRDRIGIVHDAGETMRTLVDDILDVAKMETGKLAIGTGTVDLKATLRQVAQVWRLQAEAAGIGLVLHLDNCPERIEGDGGRLRQIVFNLLSNAMKFTEKGRVELTASAATAGPDARIRISVRDSGIGIAREWHESIFELFQQVDGGTTRRYGGTGLGLAICRNLARAMGGDIWVESEPGFGSTFTIDLPRVDADAHCADVRDAGETRPSTVLVLERNPLTRGIMRAILSERFGAIAFVGSDGEACDVLAHEAVDWVVLDAASVDEYDRLIAATDAPMILIEGSDPVPEAVRVQMHAVLAKPVTKSMLLEIFAIYDGSAPQAEAA